MDNRYGDCKIYGNDIVEKIKGCEFHYFKSVNEKALATGNNCEQFKRMARELLEASTKEAYHAAHEKLKLFIGSNCNHM